MLTSFVDRISDRFRWGYLAAFLLLLLSYILTFYSSQQVSNQQERVNHTTEVMNTLDVLVTELKSAESALRGFLLVNESKFLGEYETAKPLVNSTHHKLKQLTSDNWLQQKRIDSLKILIDKKMNVMNTALNLLVNDRKVAPITIQKVENESRLLMDSIRSMTLKIKNEENRLLDERSNTVTTLSNFIKVINVASIAIAIVLAFYAISTYNRGNKARVEADKQAQEFRKELEGRVNELDKVNTELLELRSIEKFAVTGRIARTIAHEVRNPLTNINLATEHLRSEIAPAADIDILFDMISRNSNRINELINDLLNSTKASQLNFVKVNINDIVDQSLSFAQDRIDLKGIKVIKKYTQDLCPVLVDIEKINIAFLNLIVNAIEAMEDNKGILTISTEDKNNRCVVTFNDNGKGMNKDSLTKLFEPYFTTKEKGNGLGLTNTQNIILSHHATIYADSTEGIGSSFIVSFNYA